METEPVRITNFVFAIVSAVVGGLIVYLQTNDWKGGAITALTAVLSLLGAAEVARTKVVSPDTLERKTGKTLEQIS